VQKGGKSENYQENLISHSPQSILSHAKLEPAHAKLELSHDYPGMGTLIEGYCYALSRELSKELALITYFIRCMLCYK